MQWYLYQQAVKEIKKVVMEEAKYLWLFNTLWEEGAVCIAYGYQAISN